jgi:hypothetical protein
MHYYINLLRIKSLYMCRALLAHPQEALHERRLVYCMRIMSAAVPWHGYSENATVPQPADIIPRNIPNVEAFDSQ